MRIVVTDENFDILIKMVHGDKQPPFFLLGLCSVPCFPVDECTILDSGNDNFYGPGKNWVS